ncbi:Adenine specific DNA methylase (Mod-related) [Rhodococcus wratislaviensis]|uniref:Adenine specific DNA methylase (Mod-related) n=1 Tax=Rhodococcus wratislaviensis TaxID=44752 RepID=A0A402CBG5_RHOWR|nr:site-specific DNA-methyltransferase [Rhodococcus wratislaviensis]GCE40985.1 Adenine specific DNA methylase (Mod-related) [Rhodococcus wratislaviensis]
MNARKAPTPKGPTPVERIKHRDKRTNLPTADAHEFVTPEVEAPRTLLYPRDTSLDPQLVWKGKDEQDSKELEVDAPPIFIQEKIDPRVLIENLRKTAKSDELEPELTMFDVFDGLDEYDAVDFYRHSANWSNRMILGDSLQVMGSMAERESLRGQVQMVYLDPPYGIKFTSNFQTSARNRVVKDGKVEHITRDVEMIKAFRDTWEEGINSYLAYLRDRLVAAHDLLAESGSVFVQISEENLHMVRSLLDEVFGRENYYSTIVVQKTTGAGSPGELRSIPSVADFVLWYAKNKERVKYRALWKEKKAGQEGGSLYTSVRLADGSTRPLTKDEKAGDPIPSGARIYGVDNLTSSSGVDKTRYPVTINGRTYLPHPSVWKTSEEGMQRLILAGRVHAGSGKNLGYIRYLDDFPAYPLVNVWTDTVGQNQFGGDKLYVVQTANKVIERCILMSTDPGDLVLDPTCGSGTTATVAEQHGRRWITIDTSRVAVALARQRLMAAKYPYYILSDSDAGRRKELELSAHPMPTGSATNDIRHGFVYERIPHVMLRAIANNPDIVEGMTQEEIDRTIARHAEQEHLYDRPYEDKRKVRVAGPFTVESLSPHRSASFDGSTPDPDGQRATLSEQYELGDQVTNDESFEQMILSNLAASGIQNGRKSERMKLEMPESYPGQFVQAIAMQAVEGEESPLRVGLALGPQYGTVSPRFVKDAAREAITAGDIDVLAVLAFAFDPAASGVKSVEGGGDLEKTEDFAEVAASRNLGRLPVLFVRMNADLLMGDDLKKTGSGNMFMVFGEPDIEMRFEDDQVVVELLGVDVYDPNTGQVRSDDTSQIALWMIDTDYNSESFFVRHCYFTGGTKPYEQLQRALMADIDLDAWESLYSTTSRAFPRPSSSRIAVKVINDYGDEVMKIFDID